MLVRTRAPWALLALASLALVIARPAGGVVTAAWTVESYKDFDKGEADAAFITSLGEVRPGWDTERTDLDVEGVWSSALAPDGTLFVGTDDSGSVYRVAGGKATKLASIDSAAAVVSLVRADDGSLYAGTMPAGEVWRIDAAGKATKLAALAEVETVWALALDAGQKTLYAGTGPNGKLFAVDLPAGQAREVFATEDKRVTAVVAARDGSVWLGTSENAQVFRYDPKAKSGRAVADFAGNEITALADAGMSVIASVNDFEEPTTSGTKTKAAVDAAEKKKDQGEKPKMPDKGSKPGADAPANANAEPQRQRQRKGTGALYRIFGDGRTEQLHALTGTYFTAIAVAPGGQIFAGAGDKGRVYYIDLDDSVATAFDVDERLIATLDYVAKDKGDGEVVFVTSDAAALYRTTGKAKRATYTSEVFDAGMPARFGKMVWHGSGALKVETRTGNTSEPGVGWSDFAAPAGAKAAGGDSRSARTSSPSGRYAQYRVTLEGDSVLQKTRLYYLPYNQPTAITDITVAPAAEVSGATLATGSADPRSPLIKLEWKVENPDGDKTRYLLEVRREGDALWRPIATEKKPLMTTKYSWNTETFPDGYYRLRISALDDRANSADRARATAKTTPLFPVDNQKPALDGVSVSYPKATARAADAMTPIAEMAFAVDDGPWRVGATDDGLFDDTTELLRMDLPENLSPGLHTLAIRVIDEAGNINSTTATFRVK